VIPKSSMQFSSRCHYLPFVVLLLGTVSLLCGPSNGETEIVFESNGAVPVPNGITDLGRMVFLTRIIVQPDELAFTQSMETARIQVFGKFSDGSVRDITLDPELVFEFDDPASAGIVSVNNGVVSSISPGEAFINVRHSKYRGVASYFSAIVALGGGVSSVEVNPSSVTLTGLAQSVPLEVRAVYDSTVDVNAAFVDVALSGRTSYSSTDPTIASVTTDGRITAVGNGVAAISVVFDVFKISVPVLVNLAAPLVGLQMELAQQSLYLRMLGGDYPVVVTGILSDGSTVDLTAGRTGTLYVISTSSVATVSKDGVIKAASHGVAVLTATHSGLSTTILVEVNASPLVSLDTTPSGGPISVNSVSPLSGQQLSVRGTYADGSVENLTSSLVQGQVINRLIQL
jgi:hypothetical protein